jgi:hypothetical protein
MIAAVLTGVLGVDCGAQDSTESMSLGHDAGEPQLGNKKWALLIGIDEYQDPDINTLRGALNDLAAMENVLIRKFGFDPNNVLTLRNEKATRAGIRAAFRTHLSDKAGPNDVVVFYYSGHGSQVLDEPNGDESDGDGRDETIVPYDSSNSGDKDITDDEISKLLRELSARTENVTFVFDSCNSGTTSRSAGLSRRIDRDLPSRRTRGTEVKESGMKDDGASYALIAAAQAEELAFEHEADNGVVYGALTYFLTEALDRAPAGATYLDVMDVVRQDVSSLYKQQHPQLEGTNADKLVFGDARVLQESYVGVSRSQTSRDVVLDAGQIHGMTKGSVFEIYPPGARTFAPPETLLSRATITDVLARTSKALLETETAIPPGSRAVEREHSFGCRQLWVRYEKANHSALLRDTRDELAKYNFIRAAGDGERYHLLLEHVGNEIRIEAADSGVVDRLDATDAQVQKNVVDQVSKWAKWYNVLSIRNPSPSPRVGIRLTVAAETAQGQTRSFEYVGTPDAVLEEGERIVATIESRSTNDLYLHVLDLETDGTVSIVTPQEGRNVLLEKGKSVTLKLKTTIPEGHDSITDVLKVFATVANVEFGFLQQSPFVQGESRDLRGSGDPVEELVACAALGAPSPGVLVPLDRWATAERVVHVKRK